VSRRALAVADGRTFGLSKVIDASEHISAETA